MKNGVSCEVTQLLTSISTAAGSSSCSVPTNKIKHTASAYATHSTTRVGTVDSPEVDVPKLAARKLRQLPHLICLGHVAGQALRPTVGDSEQLRVDQGEAQGPGLGRGSCRQQSRLPAAGRGVEAAAAPTHRDAVGAISRRQLLHRLLHCIAWEGKRQGGGDNNMCCRPHACDQVLQGSCRQQRCTALSLRASKVPALMRAHAGVEAHSAR